MAKLIIDIAEAQKEAIKKASNKKGKTIKALVLESLEKNEVKFQK